MGCVLVDRKEGCLVDGSGRRLRPWAAFRRIVDVPIQAHFLRSSTLVAANSEHTARHVERLAGASTRIRLLYPPLADTTAADRPPISNRLFVAGRLTATKGIADAIKVTASLPQTILTVAGDGPQRVELEALCRHLGVTKRVRFLGWVPSQVVDQEIKKASVVLFPSLWPEPFGLAGAQGAVNGRPVVAYDSGGIRSWLSPDMGALVPVGDVEALTRAAERLCSDSDHALRCGRSARSAVENLLLPRFGERVEVLLHEAIELGRRTSI
jgi:glycosyltransferase involved in cell wall biosynthesis